MVICATPKTWASLCSTIETWPDMLLAPCSHARLILQPCMITTMQGGCTDAMNTVALQAILSDLCNPDFKST